MSSYSSGLYGSISGGAEEKNIKGHCMRCKCERKMENPQKYIMKGKAKNVSAKGTCVVCKCKMSKILTQKERECF